MLLQKLKKNLFSQETVSVIAIVAVLWGTNHFHNYSSQRPHYARTGLVITRSDGTAFSFAAEVAATPHEKDYGLMFVTRMAADAGMIFPYSTPQEVDYWMKNTYIPLDMLFVRPDGTIGRIVAEARPLDVTPISSQEPVVAVIEINGGVAKKDGFAIGDKVSSPVIVQEGNP
ncbi:MAG: DUF192 domain-containing protein [Alphaproteobacteria bacterium]